MYEIDYSWELDGDVRLGGTARVTFKFRPDEDVDIIRVLAVNVQLYEDGALSIDPIVLPPGAAVGLGQVIERLQEEQIRALCLERGREAREIMARG